MASKYGALVLYKKVMLLSNTSSQRLSQWNILFLRCPAKHTLRQTPPLLHKA